MRKYNSHVYRQVAKRTGITEDEARRILLNEQEVVGDMLADGHTVTLIGFGTYYTRVIPAGTAFGRPYESRAHADFRAGSGLREAVND